MGGAWPIVHHESFELFFGRKRERWLMWSVAVMLVGGGVGLLAERPSPGRGLRLAASIGAFGLGAIGGREALRGRISFLYAVDAAIEWALAAAWAGTLSRSPALPPVARSAPAHDRMPRGI